MKVKLMNSGNSELLAETSVSADISEAIVQREDKNEPAIPEEDFEFEERE